MMTGLLVEGSMDSGCWPNRARIWTTGCDQQIIRHRDRHLHQLWTVEAERGDDGRCLLDDRCTDWLCCSCWHCVGSRMRQGLPIFTKVFFAHISTSTKPIYWPLSFINKYLFESFFLYINYWFFWTIFEIWLFIWHSIVVETVLIGILFSIIMVTYHMYKLECWVLLSLDTQTQTIYFLECSIITIVTD